MRPTNVPLGTVWNEADSCWECGPTNEVGRHGQWKSWYPSGTERGSTSYVNGMVHGVASMNLGADGETPFDETFSKDVARAELFYDHGVLVRQRCFAKDGAEVGSDGAPLPVRPPTVPADATYIAPAEIWVHGPMLGGAPLHGRQRIWHRDGEPLSDVGWKDGRHHGSLHTYAYGEHRVDEPGAPIGPPRTMHVEAEYIEGELRSARFFARSREGIDVELAAASFQDRKLHGTVRWLTAEHGSFNRPIVAVEELDIVLLPSTLFRPRRLPKTHRIEADFESGELVSVRAFDMHGKHLVAPPPVSNWCQDIEPQGLAGYLASGAFERDIVAFFGELDRATDYDEDAARAEVVFARMKEPHRSAALVLDRVVRQGAMPALQTCSLSGYGFDCVKNDLYDAAEDRYFGLGYDGFGDLYLFDLETGRVRRWGHDRDPWEDGAEFPSLDAYAFGILRTELAHQGRIDSAAMTRSFDRLGFGWLAPS